MEPCAWCWILLKQESRWWTKLDIAFWHVLFCGADENEWNELEDLADEEGFGKS